MKFDDFDDLDIYGIKQYEKSYFFYIVKYFKNLYK